MKMICFAALLFSSTAAGAQSQTAPATTQGQSTTAAAQSQPAPASQTQATSCGIACSVDQGSSPAGAAPGTGPIPPKDLARLAANKSDVNRIVCEAQDTLGTRLGAKKVCMTVGQWVEFENDVKDQTRRLEIIGHVDRQ
jgi:hypothetical protein